MSILITVLLTILKVLGILLLVLLALILTALLIPVGGQVIFEGGRLTIKAKAGPVSLTVFPWTFGKKKKPQKQKKSAGSPQSKAKKPQPKPEKPAAPAPEQPAEPPKPQIEPKPKPESQPKTETKPKEPPKQAAPKYAAPAKPEKKPKQTKPKTSSSGGTLGGLPWEKITSALELLPEVLKKLFGSIRIYDICLTVPIHTQDAAATAIWYGRVNGLIGGTVAALSHVFQVELRELNVLCDYTGEAAGKEHFSCKITTHLMQMVVLGITTLIQLKKRKII